MGTHKAAVIGIRRALSDEVDSATFRADETTRQRHFFDESDECVSKQKGSLIEKNLRRPHCFFCINSQFIFDDFVFFREQLHLR